MNTVFNTAESPVIVAGAPVPAHYSAALRLARRNALDPVLAERAAALYFAELAALYLDRELFRHDLPPGVSDALVLTLSGEKPSACGADYRAFLFQLAGIDGDGDRLKRRFGLILGGLGSAGCVTISSRRISNGITFCGWEWSEAVFSRPESGGSSRFCGKVIITGTVCITPPEAAGASVTAS